MERHLEATKVEPLRVHAWFSCENAEGNVIAIRNRAELEISRQTRVRSIIRRRYRRENFPAIESSIRGYARNFYIELTITVDSLNSVWIDSRATLKHGGCLSFALRASFLPSFSCCNEDFIRSANEIRKKVLRTTQNLFNNTSRYDDWLLRDGVNFTRVILYRFE